MKLEAIPFSVLGVKDSAAIFFVFDINSAVVRVQRLGIFMHILFAISNLN